MSVTPRSAQQTPNGVGPAGAIPPEQLVRAAGLVRSGRSYSLAAPRFPGMPLFPGHPPFQVLTFRTPQGLRAARQNLWEPTPNEVGLGAMTEIVSSSTHSGAHIDALAHMTVGEDDHWYGGCNAGEHLTDFGPSVGDAAALPSMFTRGVLIDAAAHAGVDCLPAGHAVSADDVLAAAESQGVEIGRWDVVLVRTGYMGLWPDGDRMAQHKTPGPDISAAELFAERGVVAVGSDTETFEVQPAPDPGSPSNPQPVHVRLLIEEGIYIMESLDLEALAADRVYEFLFVGLPLKISGATGSMLDPLAVI
ncbi:cyclase family protein [Actinomycetospora sp. NBRC 106378]|uniref:cyclase family protein n=1 Tax=Actinomycetospora sp. NBRC 106378 TaxID=3032208 RepID=UPI0024A0A4EB|nr:cyclase family protein [Actinomycetospora sp. NBRC 106378]GLZ53515.1 polyketide cyclase [Actinomycetospora sp. NBRC 106378]